MDEVEYDREMAAIREEAGEEVFKSAWRKGQEMDLDRFVLLAVEDGSPPPAG